MASHSLKHRKQRTTILWICMYNLDMETSSYNVYSSFLCYAMIRNTCISFCHVRPPPFHLSFHRAQRNYFLDILSKFICWCIYWCKLSNCGNIFYAPGSIDPGHILFLSCLFVCLSVCLLSTLTLAITFEQ